MKRYLSRDRLKDYSLIEINELILFSLEYCKNKLGINKRKKKELTYGIYNGDLTNGCYGFYDPDEHEIIVMLKVNKTIKDIVGLICHEYTHSLQPCKSQYTKLLNKHGYENHPFEKEAISNEYIFKEILREYRKTL
jgi:hypothetical protein